MEFKNWTKEEVEKFCEENFIEQVEWLQNFVCSEGIEAAISMDTSENDKGNLKIVIKGKEA